jgi:hypothetical protein
MSEKSTPQYASVRQAFGCDPAVVHCPICGASAFRTDKLGNQRPPCHHLAFIYVGRAGEFGYQSLAFEKKFANVNVSDVSFQNFQSLLEKAGYDNKMLAIEVSYGAMDGYKPVWCTDVYGYDYGAITPCTVD